MLCCVANNATQFTAASCPNQLPRFSLGQLPAIKAGIDHVFMVDKTSERSCIGLHQCTMVSGSWMLPFKKTSRTMRCLRSVRFILAERPLWMCRCLHPGVCHTPKFVFSCAHGAPRRSSKRCCKTSPRISLSLPTDPENWAQGPMPTLLRYGGNRRVELGC